MRHQHRILAATMALWLIALNGCGSMPAAPQLDSGVGARAGHLAGDQGLTATTDDSTGISVPAPIVDPLQPPLPEPAFEATATVDGALGGKIQLDNVSVQVPKDCFAGAAQIKVTIPDSAKLEVHLEIFPATKNHFDTPVRLGFNARAAGKDPRVMIVCWRDPVDGRWVPIETTFDPVTGIVSADLAHFSEYECVSEVQGRAGW